MKIIRFLLIINKIVFVYVLLLTTISDSLTEQFTFSSSIDSSIAPKHVRECQVYLGSRLISTPSILLNTMTRIVPFRHLYVNVFESPTLFANIEAGHTGEKVLESTRSWALVKDSNWEYRGKQWMISSKNCSKLIQCLREKTSVYTKSNVPYHVLWGPNSNSFIGWLLKACEIKFTSSWTSFLYAGIDYYERQTTVASNAPFVVQLMKYFPNKQKISANVHSL